MNYEIIKKLKKLAVSLTMLSMLVGCNNRDYNKTNDISKTPTNIISNNTPVPTEETKTNNDNTIIPNNPTPNEDDKIIEDLKLGIKSNVDEIKEFFNNGKGKEALETGKIYSIKIIDFMFYGGELGGLTFDNLSEQTKKELYDYLKDLDSILVSIEPEYKEEFGERYSIIKDFTSKEYNQAKNYIINKIGEEKYNDIITKKDEYFGIAKEKASEYKEKILDFLDKKYQNYKKEQ